MTDTSYLEETLGNATVVGGAACGMCYNAVRVFYAPFPREQNIMSQPQKFECGWKYVSSQWQILKLSSTRIIDIIGDVLLFLVLVASSEGANNLLSLAIMFRILFWRIFSIGLDWRVYGVLRYEWNVMLEASILFARLTDGNYHYNETYRRWTMIIMGFCEVFTVAFVIMCTACNCLFISWIYCPSSSHLGCKTEVPDYPLNQGKNEKAMRYIAQWFVGMTKLGSIRFKLFLAIHYIMHIQEGFGFTTPWTMMKDNPENETDSMILYPIKIIINGILFIVSIVLYRREFIRFLKVSFKQFICRCCCVSHKESEVWNDIFMYQVIYTGQTSPITITTLSGQKRDVKGDQATFGGFSISVEAVNENKQNDVEDVAVVVDSKPNVVNTELTQKDVGVDSRLSNQIELGNQDRK